MSTPRPLNFYDASDLPLLLKRSRFLIFPLPLEGNGAVSETLFTNQKRRKNILQMQYNAGIFFTKKRLERSMISKRKIDSVHYVVRDAKNKRVEYISLLYFLRSKYYLEELAFSKIFTSGM